jgi:hypothetical protein
MDIPAIKVSHFESRWLMRLLLGSLLLFEIIYFLQQDQLDHLTRAMWAGVISTSVLAWVTLEGINMFLVRRHASPLLGYTIFLAILAIYLDGFGNMWGWYASYPRFDNLVHALSGLAGTTVLMNGFYGLAQASRWRVPPVLIVYLGFSTMALGGMGFELVEYMSDRVFGVDFWLGDGVDTVTDLAMNMLGSLLALGLLLTIVKPLVARWPD